MKQQREMSQVTTNLDALWSRVTSVIMCHSHRTHMRSVYFFYKTGNFVIYVL